MLRGIRFTPDASRPNWLPLKVNLMCPPEQGICYEHLSEPLSEQEPNSGKGSCFRVEGRRAGCAALPTEPWTARESPVEILAEAAGHKG